MTWQQSLGSALRSLRKEEQRITKQLDSVRENIANLQGLSTRGRVSAAGGRKRGTRRLSAKGRDAIARAARKRWAEYRAQKQKAAR